MILPQLTRPLNAALMALSFLQLVCVASLSLVTWSVSNLVFCVSTVSCIHTGDWPEVMLDCRALRLSVWPPIHTHTHVWLSLTHSLCLCSYQLIGRQHFLCAFKALSLWEGRLITFPSHCRGQTVDHQALLSGAWHTSSAATLLASVWAGRKLDTPFFKLSKI